MDSVAFNIKLQGLASRLENQDLQNVKVAYYDTYSTLLDMINNPAKYGYEQTLKGCCGSGLFEFGLSCNVTTTCPDASKYVFWDAVHPTLQVYSNLANIAQETVIPHVLGY
ncbi:hypothetical protein JCGZ_01226 [Jatropha curcas]|uniref:GDSL esterase/lipase n=2 Tax=Jatropha curcas TaxID=180498 RepID=A0A067L8H6_JATCU|nr:hypothetical protein JCGZ_01226 [Jatropha curcas]